MDRKIEQLGVRTTTEGGIDIIQAGGLGDDDSQVVRITTDQVKILIHWLKDAKAELKSGEPKRTAKVELKGDEQKRNAKGSKLAGV